MKWKLPILAALLITAQSSMAQLKFGVKAGVNISKIDGKSFKDEFGYGYLLGGFANIGLGGKLSIQPEVLLSQSQNKVDNDFNAIYQNAFADASSGNVKLNYLSIPILLDYKLNKLISLQAGPQFSVLINKDKTALQNGQNAFDNGDLSLVAGPSIHLGGINITGRYGIGLNNINDIDDKDKWKSQAIQLSLGLRF
ncbi:MAG: PorT family protein [Flaviaesturariibacter sp.]|nr:PorT family protein [Flaviaesturariibacter sp.]